MDIDKIFQVPKLPGEGNKRRLPDAPTPDMLKKMKVDSMNISSDPIVLSTNSRQATVEDGDDDAFAPGGDADYFAEEDEEGRFFGGGLTSEQKDILNIFDKVGGEGVDNVEGLSITRIRRLLLAFERAVDKNHDQRSKYPDDPSRFIDSEADLDAAIKSLLPLSQAPSLSYPEIVRSGLVKLLVGLLTHDNVDVVIDVVELVHELTDEDAEVDQETEEYQGAQEAVNMLINSLVENSILELLVDNLSRLNEEEESDSQGVFHVLGIFENFVSLIPSLATALVSKTTVMKWLLKRIQGEKHDENRGYAAELLSILLQTSVDNKTELAKHDGVETLLKVLSQYRKRDPFDADETEFMENLFDSLCSALSESSIKQLFLDAEGPDLMILMIKDRMEAKSRCIKVLDYAMSGTDGAPVCNAFVEALGLKTIFTAFMGKATKRLRAAETTPASDDVAHSLGIISSLLTNLPADSNSRLRLLAKFVDSDYEKIDKLIEIREAARKRLKETDLHIQQEKQDALDDLGFEGLSAMEDAFYLQRLDGGLFTLQTVDYILAWVVAEDDGIRTHALLMLDRNNQGLHDVLDSIRLYEEHADDDFKDGSISQREILRGLISVLSTR